MEGGILFLLLLCVIAPGDHIRQYVAEHWKQWDVTGVRLRGPWCVVDLSYRADGRKGQLLWREDGGWRLASGPSRGTELTSQELAQNGVAPGDQPELLGHAPEPAQPGPYWTIFSQKPLAQVDAEGTFTSWALMLARNELFARHGRAFEDPFLRGYFARQSWYKVRRDFRETDLTALERANVRALQDRESKLRAEEPVVH